MNLDDPLQFLKGVGPERARRLERLGLATLRDLLWYPPKGYMDRSRVVPLDRLVPGAEQTALVRAGNGRLSGGRGRMPVFELPLRDETGEASAVWFGQAYLARTLTLGASLLVHGKVRLHAEPTGVGRRGRPGLQFQNPEYELLGSGDADETLQGGRIVPLYGLTQGITQKSLRVLVHAALEAIGDGLVDPLPREMRGRLLLPALIDAIRALHYPETNEQAELARRRLAYDELLALQLALGWVKRARAASTAAPPRRTEPNPRFRRDALVARFVEALPFRLTGGQERVWLEIRRDLEESTPMNRLLQGDVGSGKTVVAALACLAAIEGGSRPPTSLRPRSSPNSRCNRCSVGSVRSASRWGSSSVGPVRASGRSCAARCSGRRSTSWWEPTRCSSRRWSSPGSGWSWSTSSTGSGCSSGRVCGTRRGRRIAS